MANAVQITTIMIFYILILYSLVIKLINQKASTAACSLFEKEKKMNQTGKEIY